MTDIPPVEIAANDCYLIRVGAECVITAAKKACTLNIELDIDDGGASMRDAQASAVKDLID